MVNRNAATITLTSLLTCTALLAATAHATDKKAETVDKGTLEEVVDESRQNDQGAVKGAGKVEKKEEAGEASYNIENCEALLESAADGKAAGKSSAGKSADKGAQKLDLDKCRQLIK